jgi:ABC-type branched-subunit amino acid transport system substrate-binding protein
MRSLLLSLVLFSACSGDDGQYVYMGSIISLTGDLSGIGPEILSAIELACDEMSTAGGVMGGHGFRVLAGNDNSSAERAGTVAGQLAPRVPAIIGAIGSGMTLQALPQTKTMGSVLISGSATSPALTVADDDNLLFRTCPSDALQGKLIAQRAVARGFKRMAVAYIPGAYGEGLAASFAESFTQAGGTVTASIEYVEEQQSYNDLLDQLYVGAPESILLVAYANDGGQIIRDYLSGYSSRGTFWYFSDGLGDPAFIVLVGPSNFTFQHEGTAGAAPMTPDFSAYAAKIQAKNGAPPQLGTFSANYYDATMLIGLAIAEGKSQKGTDIRDHMYTVSKGGKKYGPAQIKEALAAAAAGQDIDFDGITGNLDFDEFGDVVGPYDVWQVVDGKVTVTEPSVLP